MVKVPKLGQLTKAARRAGERRVKRLEAVLAIENIPQRVRDWAKAQKKEIQSAMQGTRQYAKDGHRYKSKNESYIRKQLDRLNAAVKKVVPNYTPPRDTFKSTQQQINLASSKQTESSSIYTREEVKLFYRIHEKLWNKPGVDEHSRNKAILDALNDKRKEQGLPPISLAEAMEATLRANKRALDLQSLDPSRKLDEFSKSAYEEAQKYDDEDGPKGSPTNSSVIKLIKGAFDALLKQVDVTTIFED